MSHEVFKEPEEGEGAEGEEGEGQEEKKDTDIISSFKHTYVPEVVREPRMHF